jgi:hypothetical protein
VNFSSFPMGFIFGGVRQNSSGLQFSRGFRARSIYGHIYPPEPLSLTPRFNGVVEGGTWGKTVFNGFARGKPLKRLQPPAVSQAPR